MAPLTLAQQKIKEETTKALIEINKANRKHKKEEHLFQCQVVQYLKLNGYTVYAIPNGGSRNAIEGANLKKEGVLAGVADLEVMLPNGRHIYLELKTKIGKQSQSQKDFEDICKKLRHPYYVVRSLDEVINILQEYKTAEYIANRLKETSRLNMSSVNNICNKHYKICNVCHTPTSIDELDDEGVCIWCGNSR